MKWIIRINDNPLLHAQEVPPHWCKEEAHILTKAIENFLKEKRPLPVESRIRVGQRY